MGFKKKFGMGAASALLGLSLIGGGTYAYFSSSAVTDNTFAAGTLDLAVQPSTIINIDNIAPGDSMTRVFELQNNGTLDIKNVTLDTSYTVVDAKGDNMEDFGKHIEVEFLYNMDQFNQIIYKTTLDKLQGMSPKAVSEKIFEEALDGGVLAAGDEHDLVVKFNFLDNGENQNQFQGDKIKLKWTFNATQGNGRDL
ncbi:TasA family protein [Neobacillus novalis]|uniref:TasA family protein n=1 Tax=Neobacillus novalis TaxID=220687 RepID=A0AA95MQ31_9BACI|nr:TasA family protein [Neobacillus novalis]WHY87515.1 TasA family protein [Neobacillus novalis]